MTSIFDIFKPAPYIEPIKNEQVVDETYRYWRIRILYSMFIGYAFYYFTRKSFSIAMPGLIQELHFDKSQLGLLGSIFSVTYGFSKFASGFLADRTNPRYLMAFGLIATGVVNILFGMSSSIILFAIFWGLNGYFQGFGWPPCARFLTQWYSHSERGSWWSTWNVSHNVGAFLILYIGGFCLQYLGWRYAMFVPGVICIFGGFFLINRLRDTPQSLGLPTVEAWRNDYGSSKAVFEDESRLTTREILMEYVFKNKYMWFLAFAYFFVYGVRTGMNDWMALYLIEAKGYSAAGANVTASFFEVGGFTGSLTAGWASDKLFRARRGPVNVLFACCMCLSILGFWMIPADMHWLNAICIALVGFSIFGPQMLIGVAAAEMSHKKAAATATGFVGLFAYIGAAVAGYPLGKITQVYGWEGFFWSLFICSFIALLFLLPLYGVTENNKKL